jgi:polar amino acid transport system substrate-binding protein
MEVSMNLRSRTGAIALAVVLLAMACAGPGGTGSPTASGPAATTPASSASATAAGDPNDLLAKVKAAGVMRVNTDPKYPPQSELKPDGTFEGFDIDVANELGKRLGVDVKFETFNFDLVVAGGWAERWDLSVGSVTITEERTKVLDFTKPYYFTPAQMAATTASGITTMDGLAGKTVCVGEATTYFDWLTGNLKLVGSPTTPATPPAGVKATTFSTDTECAEAVASGRTDFEGFLTSSTTIEAAIKNDAAFVKVGEPVFFESLAVAVDKGGPPHAEFMAEMDRLIAEMHADGTLSTFSKKWFDGLDLTKTE